MTIDKNGAKPNIYTSITNQIVAALEQGVKPWNAAHAAGHVSRPLRHSAQPYADAVVLGDGEALCSPDLDDVPAGV